MADPKPKSKSQEKRFAAQKKGKKKEKPEKPKFALIKSNVSAPLQWKKHKQEFVIKPFAMMDVEARFAPTELEKQGHVTIRYHNG